MARKFIDLKAQFLLPEDFEGTAYDAIKLIVEHCESIKEKNQVAVPNWIEEDYEGFDYTVKNDGKLYARYFIQNYIPLDEEDGLFESDIE